MGTIRPQTPTDEFTFLEAAETTANQPADTSFEYATTVQSLFYPKTLIKTKHRCQKQEKVELQNSL